ncbi:MAG: T9SS type A sorting domain-containing protein, partial [Marinoscillum sp.]
YFYANSMENGEDFWVRYYNGSSWSTVASYARGTNFDNNTFYVATVTLDASNYTFPSNAQIRFQCDASGNNDQIYIDGVTVTGISSGAKAAGNSIAALDMERRVVDMDNGVDIDGFNMYPNPTIDRIALMVDVDENAQVQMVIHDVQGRVVLKKAWSGLEGVTKLDVDVSSLEKGLYFVRVNDGNGLNEVQKLIKR